MGQLNSVASLLRKHLKLTFFIIFVSSLAIAQGYIKELSVDGNITVGGTVDGRDVAADGATLDTIDTNLGAITSGEADQIENIDSETISNTQWGFLGALDQALQTVSDVVFGSLGLGGSPDSTSLFEVKSTTKGAIPYPKMTEAQRDAISTPATGLTVFNTSTNKPNVYDGTLWGELGGGSGQGGINYVVNHDLEDSVTNDVDVTGSYWTRSAETTDPLRGAQSLKMVYTSSATVSDYFEFALTDIDPRDIGKAVYVSFDYYTAGSFATDDIKVVLRNVDSSNDVLVRGGNGSGQLMASSGKTSFRGVAYLDATDNTYTLRLRINQATSGGTIYVDNVKVGPDKLIDSPVNLQYMGTYTPTITTGTGTATNYTATAHYWRRGDRAVVRGHLVFTGAPGTWGVNLGFSMPPGLTRDISKMPQSHAAGSAVYTDSGTGWSAGYAQVGFSSIELSSKNSSGTYVFATYLSNTVPFPWVSGDSLEFEVEFPVAEWAENSSATYSTTETMNGLVHARYYVNSAGAIPNASGTIVNFSAKSHDTHNAVTTGGNWKFTAPKSSWYKIGVTIPLSTASAATRLDTLLRKNGIGVKTEFYTWGFAWAGVVTSKLDDTIFLNKGEYIDINHWETVNGGTYAGSQIITIDEDPDYTVFAVSGETEVIKSTGASGLFTSLAGVSGSTWYDLTSINLTPGEWEITAQAQFAQRSAAAGTFTSEFGVSTESGNSFTDGTQQNYDTAPFTNLAWQGISANVDTYTVTISEDTTYYLKAKAGRTPDGNFWFNRYYMRARRIK